MSRPLEPVRRHPVISFFVLAYLISWGVWIPMALAGVRVRQGVGWPTHIPGLFGPAIAALAVTAIVGGRAAQRDLLTRVVRWRADLVSYVAALSPLGFFVVAAVAAALMGKGWPDLGELTRFSGLPAVGVGVMVVLLLVSAYAEEIGWRGFAVPQIQRSRGLLGTGLIVGAFWALWHLPSMFIIQNYRELGATFLPGFVLGILAGSIFLAWLYNRSGGSIFIVAVWHTTYNLFAGTAAAHGLVAAIVSTGVMAWALAIVAMELVKHRPRRGSVARTA
jgi:membrane protease YdiL (CAAX protease family)